MPCGSCSDAVKEQEILKLFLLQLTGYVFIFTSYSNGLQKDEEILTLSFFVKSITKYLINEGEAGVRLS